MKPIIRLECLKKLGEKVNWSLIAKKAWETRRKNAGKTGETRSERKAVKGKKLTEDDKFRWRMFEADSMKYLDEGDKLEREMHRHMRRKELMERALGVYENRGIYFGKEVEKRKVERWSGGVKFGN